MKKLWILPLSAVIFACLCGCAGCKKSGNVATRYEIIAEYAPKSATVNGTAKVTFENRTGKSISLLKFQLYPNAYRKNALQKPIADDRESAAYYEGASYGEMVISSVHGSKSWEVMGEDENILYVYLERKLAHGDTVVLDIGFVTKLAKVKHRTGITPNAVNLGNFYPTLCGWKDGAFLETAYTTLGDPFYQDCADYTVRLTLPKEYEVAASGKTYEERVLESKKVCSVSVENARDFCLVAAEKYRSLTTHVGQVELSYFYYADGDPTRTLETAKSAFIYYQKTFGTYPYESYTIAETGLCFSAQEYPALTLLSDGLAQEERTRVIAHETAHQWWYAVVGSDQTQNAWQDEGLAEYSALSFFEEHEEFGITRAQEIQSALGEYRNYYAVYGNAFGQRDTRMMRPLQDYQNEYEYHCISTDKAVVMLDLLRKSVGDKKFFSALRRYYEKNRFAMATPDGFIGSFEKVGGDVRGLVEGFLSGKGVL